MLQIAPGILIHPNSLHEEFIRSSGAGGQNVNKVATAVQLRFDVTASGLPLETRQRLLQLAGKRATRDGAIVLKAQTQRSQERNREEALKRLGEMIVQASRRCIVRRPTKPTRASQQRRLQAKQQRSQVKAQRRGLTDNDG